MVAFGFRHKLLLSKLLIVAGTTAATLYILRQSIDESYQRILQDQSKSQLETFATKREARLEMVQTICRNVLSKSVRLVAAMNEGDEPNLYDVARGELRLVLEDPTRPASFHRFLDATGRYLAPPAGQAGILPPATESLLRQQLEATQKAMFEGEAQQAGYIAIETDGSAPKLHELILTRIVDRGEEQTVGALVLGFPVDYLQESGKDRTKWGLWLNECLYSETIETGAQKGIAARVREGLRRSTRLGGESKSSLGGASHMISYNLVNPKSGFPPVYYVCLLSMAEADQLERSLSEQILALAILAMVAGLILALLLSHGLSRPIRALVKGTTEIQQGNYSVKVPVRSRDELGRLSVSFNDMAAGLALKEKYRHFLNVMADPKVAEELVKGRLMLGGELRHVSVLFCDIRGFTALTEGMEPNQVVDLLNAHMTALARVVHEHRGVVDKFVGDLIMAVFGAPKSYENDALDAARCAIRMIEERENLNQSSRHIVRVGIGIASGKVVAGCMGSSNRQNYTVLGDRVNLASRLCSQAKPMEVIIDESTRGLLDGQARTETLPALKLKGFSVDVQAYRLMKLSKEAVPA